MMTPREMLLVYRQQVLNKKADIARLNREMTTAEDHIKEAEAAIAKGFMDSWPPEEPETDSQKLRAGLRGRQLNRDYKSPGSDQASAM
jgi:predicted RNA polymerase sigma factor